MTAEELIQELKKFPKDKKVVVEGTSMGITEFYHVGLVYEEDIEVTQDDGIEMKEENVILIS